MLVKECVLFYNKCWKDRCTLMADDADRKNMLLLEVQNITEQYEQMDKIGIRSYLRSKPSNMAVQTNDFISHWIRVFNHIQRNSPRFKTGDIRNFLNPN